MARNRDCHVIVMGNEKGGSGKTTTSMHLIAGLMKLGFSVGCIDIDPRQRSLTRYLENRKNAVAKTDIVLELPQHFVIDRSQKGIVAEAQAEEQDAFEAALGYLMENNDFVLVDSPGTDSFLSRLAHSYADTVITPINDSFLDLDVLARVDSDTMKVVKPSIYSEMVWQQKLTKAQRGGKSIDWIVMRNRLSNIDARNKRNMEKVLLDLAKRIAFRQAAGFSERVIYRELFLDGLTVLDVFEAGAGVQVSMSHVAARQEIRNLLAALNIDVVTEALEEEVRASKTRLAFTQSAPGYGSAYSYREEAAMA